LAVAVACRVAGVRNDRGVSRALCGGVWRGGGRVPTGGCAGQHRADTVRQLGRGVQECGLQQTDLLHQREGCGRLGRGAAGDAEETGLLRPAALARALRGVEHDRDRSARELIGERRLPALDSSHDPVGAAREFDRRTVRIQPLEL